MIKPKDAFLTVSLEAPSNARWSGALPIEVRDCDNLVLTARGVSDGTLDLPAGRYLVTALLPNGEGAAAEEEVSLKSGEHGNVRLSVRGLDSPASLETTETLGDSIRQLALPVSKYFSAVNAAVVKGNLLGARTGEGAAAIAREPTARSNIKVPFSAIPAWLELEAKDACTYVAIPVDDGGTTMMRWHADSPSGGLDLKFDFQNGETNSFLDFIQNDRAFEARAIGKSIVAQSEQYMMDKSKSPLRAILGAYVLLRSNELEGMRTWTYHLVDRCAWLPDALAVRVEYLARSGEHSEAVKLLLDAPRWGVPWFRSGVGYLGSRAKIYASVAAGKASELPLSDSELQRLRHIAEVLNELAAAIDMTQFTTVLRNIARVV